MCTANQNYLIEAFNRVLDWDLPDNLLSMAVADEASLMAGFDHEAGYDDWELSPESLTFIPH